MAISCDLDDLVQGTAIIIISGDSVKLSKAFEAPKAGFQAYLTASIDDPYMPLLLEFLANDPESDVMKPVKQRDYEDGSPEIATIIGLPSPEGNKMVRLLEFYSAGGTFENFFMGELVRTLAGPKCHAVIIFNRVTDDSYMVTVLLGLKGSPFLFELDYEVPIKELLKVFKLKEHA